MTKQTLKHDLMPLSYLQKRVWPSTSLWWMTNLSLRLFFFGFLRLIAWVRDGVKTKGKILRRCEIFWIKCYSSKVKTMKLLGKPLALLTMIAHFPTRQFSLGLFLKRQKKKNRKNPTTIVYKNQHIIII